MNNRNPIAKALKSRHLAPKRVTPRKGRGSYSRKGKLPRYDRRNASLTLTPLPISLTIYLVE